MQIQSVGLRAIELVALDGTSQAVGVGTMDAQLVCTAGLGIEGDKAIDNLVIRYGPFAMFHIYDLPWTIHRVGSQRQRDGAFYSSGLTQTFSDCP